MLRKRIDQKLIVLIALIHVLIYVEPLDRRGVHGISPVLGRAPIVVEPQRLGLPRPVHAPPVVCVGPRGVPEVDPLPLEHP